MTALPAAFQWILTEITGKALPGYEPPFRWTPLGRFAMSIVILLTGIGLGALGMKLGGFGYLLVLPGWLLTVSAMRSWQTSYVHHQAHGNFLPGWIGNVLADTLSTLIWIQPLGGYRADHLLHHAALATEEDADLRFLAALGFAPGWSVRDYWRYFLQLMISPKFHLTYAWFRLRANFLTASPGRRIAALGWTALVGTLWLSAPLATTLLWLIPAWPLYHLSGLMQLLTEHNWVRVGTARDSKSVVVARLTNGRFFGETLRDGSASTVFVWGLKMLVLHLPQRLYIAQDDLTNHDLHHRRTMSDWSNAAYVRRDMMLTRGGAAVVWTEHWGFIAAAEETFRLLASLPPDARLGDPMTYGERVNGMLGM